LANGQSQELKEEYRKKIMQTQARFSPYRSIVRSVAEEIDKHLQRKEMVVGECAQGEMLDVNNAYYPFGTSSETNAAGVWVGLGVGAHPMYMGDVIGVAKAYVSRVGNGPFVTEIEGEEGVMLREKGHEYGTTTGRPRRVGWFDVPMVQASRRASGLTGLAITKIDVLGGMDQVKIAVSYNLHGQQIQGLPVIGYGHCVPMYETFAGWPELTKEEYLEELKEGVASVKNDALRLFLQRVEMLVGVPIKMISFGAESDAFISYL